MSISKEERERRSLIILSDRQKDLITSLMLGDGNIPYPPDKTKTSRLAVRRKSTDVEYLEYEINIFKNIISDYMAIPKIRETFHKVWKKTYYSVGFTTISLPIFGQEYYHWYKNGKKIVPMDLKINSQIIACWICDDGSFSYDEKGNNAKLTLCTNGFKKEDVLFLIDLLHERYGSESVFYLEESSSSRKNIKIEENKQYLIICRTYTLLKVIEDIDAVFPSEMNRKAFWRNFPNSINRLSSSNKICPSTKDKITERHNKIIELCNEKKSFTYKELSEFAGWTGTLNVKNNIPNVKMLKYLKKYINQEYLSISKIKGSIPHSLLNIFIITPLGEKFFAEQFSLLQQNNKMY